MQNQQLTNLILSYPSVKNRLKTQIGAILNLDAPADRLQLQNTIEAMLDGDNIALLLSSVLSASGGTDEIIRDYAHNMKLRYANQVVQESINSILSAAK